MTDLTWAHETERDTSRYEIDGKRVVSVTEALSIVGMVRFDGIPLRRLEEAARRGKMAHAITAAMDRGEPVGELPEAVRPYVSAYEKFRADSGFIPELIEHVVINATHRYCGTLDRVGILNGRRALIDLKCSSVLYRWVGRQLAGYELALQEEPTSELGSLARFSLRLLKDGRYRLDPHVNRQDRGDFLAAVRVSNVLIEDGLVTL